MKKRDEILLYIAAFFASCFVAGLMYIVEKHTGILLGALTVLVGLVFLCNFVYRKYTGRDMKWLKRLKNKFTKKGDE